ncbi:MAG: methyltransferase domain-containing protein [Spirochaetales bacterium]|nr:methyltransferase domain-containing protein [Spirochaetales bacterium]
MKKKNPFLAWHLETKQRKINTLFQKYLKPGQRFIDIGCGHGNELALASRHVTDGELWGIDYVSENLKIAGKRVPDARLIHGDIQNMDKIHELPDNYFDVLHEYGATFLVPRWWRILPQYIRLVKPGGLIFWELSDRFSIAYLVYLFSVVPRLDETDTIFKRIIKSLLPSKFTFLSKAQIARCLEKNKSFCKLLELFPLFSLYIDGPLTIILNTMHTLQGNAIFDKLDKALTTFYNKYSGYYLILRKI